MRIRKLIAQKKISATISPSPSSNTPSLISATISSAPAGAVTTTVSTQEREKILEEPQLDVCELNMSPWDLISAEDLVYYYPGEDFKLKEESEDYDDGKVTDDSVNADEDQISMEEYDSESGDDDEETEEDELDEKPFASKSKMKLGLKSLMKKKNKKRKRDNGEDDDSDDYEKQKKKRVIYCCKTDGKGWHCRSKAQPGNPLCEHHMIQMQGYVDHQRDIYLERKIRKLESKKTSKSKIGRLQNESTSIRGRRNKGKLSAKKSSEFYYYSGFGPKWGKSKRVRPPNEVKKPKEEEEDAAADEELEEKPLVSEEAIVRRRSPSPVMKVVKEEPIKKKKKIVKEEEKDNDNDNDNGCMFVEDDFDDTTDEDTNGGSTKKRFRKPIKARSLSSLF